MKGKASAYLIGIVAFIALIITSSSVYVIDETKQVIITQFGEPVGEPITDAGLHFKIPMIQKVTFFEKRIMQWDGDPNQIPTADKKYIWVNTFARWRIKDPLKFYQSVTNERNAMGRLDDIIDGVTRDYVSENLLIEVVRNSNRTMVSSSEGEDKLLIQADSLTIEKGRSAIMALILEKVKEIVPQYGIEVEDIQIKHVNYIDEVRTKVFDRMISERKRIAQLYRSEGEGNKAEIEGQMGRELKRIQSEAYRKAQEIKGNGDAEATQIYANAYNRDPEFYSFLQTLETYRQTLGSGSTIVLSTDSEYLKYLKVLP